MCSFTLISEREKMIVEDERSRAVETVVRLRKHLERHLERMNVVADQNLKWMKRVRIREVTIKRHPKFYAALR